MFKKANVMGNSSLVCGGVVCMCEQSCVLSVVLAFLEGAEQSSGLSLQ